MFMKDFTRSLPAVTLVQPRPTTTLLQPVIRGMVAGTLVETALGWTPVQNLKVGDAVQTLDGGLARIHALDRCTVSPQSDLSLILIPGGCHDACSDLMLVPGQHLLIDTLADAPYALVPAAALTVDPLVRRHAPQTPTEVITLLFADEEVVFANSGVMVHCPGMMDGAGRYPDNSFFPRYDILTARDILRHRAARLAA